MRDEGVVDVAGHPLLRDVQDSQGVSIPVNANYNF